VRQAGVRVAAAAAAPATTSGRHRQLRAPSRAPSRLARGGATTA
jgi:hypothetical protein